MSTTTAKLTALESDLASAISGRVTTLTAINARQADAQATLATFLAQPDPAKINTAIEAQHFLERSGALGKQFEDQSSWAGRSQATWIKNNFEGLCRTLEELLVERTAHRAQFRETAAKEIGKLSSEIVLLETSGTDADLLALNTQLEEIEDDLAVRENTRRAAQQALKNFVTCKGLPRPAGAQPFEFFCTARDLVMSINFEPVPPSLVPPAPVKAMAVSTLED